MNQVKRTESVLVEGKKFQLTPDRQEFIINNLKVELDIVEEINEN